MTHIFIRDTQSIFSNQTGMMSSFFYKHGLFCASRPWEVILSTLTLSACLVSVGIFTTPDKVCGWNYECEQQQVKTI